MASKVAEDLEDQAAEAPEALALEAVALEETVVAEVDGSKRFCKTFFCHI